MSTDWKSVGVVVWANQYPLGRVLGVDEPRDGIALHAALLLQWTGRPAGAGEASCPLAGQAVIAPPGIERLGMQVTLLDEPLNHTVTRKTEEEIVLKVEAGSPDGAEQPRRRISRAPVTFNPMHRR